MVIQVTPILRELIEQGETIRRLTEENEQLRAAAPAARTMKRRSPADWTFRVVRWEEGEQVIQPREGPANKRVPNLRVYIHPDDPNEGAPYWDITSKRVIEALRPILPLVAGSGRRIRVRKDGDGPTSQFSVDVEPPAGPP